MIGNERQSTGPVYVGSVKTNVGHTEGAAGVAGVIKAALALHHREIPASLHHAQPNPAVAWTELGLVVPRALTAWPAGDGPRLAGVSAFGITGTNAHVVLGEAPAAAPSTSPGQTSAARRDSTVTVLPLSARSQEALAAVAARYAERLDGPDAPSLEDVAWNAAARRTHLEHRAMFIARDRREMADALRRFAAGDSLVRPEPCTRPRVRTSPSCFPDKAASGTAWLAN